MALRFGQPGSRAVRRSVPANRRTDGAELGVQYPPRPLNCRRMMWYRPRANTHPFLLQVGLPRPPAVVGCAHQETGAGTPLGVRVVYFERILEVDAFAPPYAGAVPACRT